MTAPGGGPDGTAGPGGTPAAGARPEPPGSGPPAPLRPADTAQSRPSDAAQSRPSDAAQSRPSDAVQSRPGEAVLQVQAAEHEGRPPAAGVVGNVVVAAAVVGIGVATMLVSWALGVGSARTPDTGTWPLLVSVVLVVLGVALLAAARRTTDAERFSRAGLLVVAGLATMIAFVAVLETIGFEIPAALLTFAWLRFLGGEGWRTSIVTSIGVVVAFYVVFVAVLAVPVPHMF